MGSRSDVRARLAALAWAAAIVVLVACDATALEATGAHPANPAARTTPPPDPPPTLRAGFDPDRYLADPASAGGAHAGHDMGSVASDAGAPGAAAPGAAAPNSTGSPAPKPAGMPPGHGGH